MSVSGRLEKIPPTVVICGPTAGGKTALAMRLAEQYALEIVSADSRQVYRGMDIGTAKATAEERARVPHHLIDVAEPDEDFSAFDFLRRGRAALDAISDRRRLPLVVGGTGLYIDALLHGLVAAPAADPELRRALENWESRRGAGSLQDRLRSVDPEMAARLERSDRVRIIRALEVFYLTGRRLTDLQRQHAIKTSPCRVLMLGVMPDRDLLYDRINRRVEDMFEAGLLEETEKLLAEGYSAELKALKTIGYRECIQYLNGRISRQQAKDLIQRDSRRYAKRQLTWFGRRPEIIWLDSPREFAKVLKLIDHFTMST